MAKLSHYCGYAIAGMSHIDGLAIPAAAPEWLPVTTALYVNPTLAPTFDPGLQNDGLVVTDATGNHAFDLTASGAGPTTENCAFWRLYMPPGWSGNGEWALKFRITAQSAFSANGGAFIGLCDNGGTPIGGIGMGIGMLRAAGFGASETDVLTINNAGIFYRIGMFAYPGDAPTVLATFQPLGRIGNEANVGLQDGYRTATGFSYNGGTYAIKDSALVMGPSTVTGGLYMFVGAGSGAAAGTDMKVTLRFEYCLSPTSPSGEWPA